MLTSNHGICYLVLNTSYLEFTRCYYWEYVLCSILPNCLLVKVFCAYIAFSSGIVVTRQPRYTWVFLQEYNKPVLLVTYQYIRMFFPKPKYDFNSEKKDI